MESDIEVYIGTRLKETKREGKGGRLVLLH